MYLSVDLQNVITSVLNSNVSNKFCALLFQFSSLVTKKRISLQNSSLYSQDLAYCSHQWAHNFHHRTFVAWQLPFLPWPTRPVYLAICNGQLCFTFRNKAYVENLYCTMYSEPENLSSDSECYTWATVKRCTIITKARQNHNACLQTSWQTLWQVPN